MRSYRSQVSSGLLLLCIHINLKWINSFSPFLTVSHTAGIPGIRRNQDGGLLQLRMVAGGDISEVPAGKIVVRRHLYRFSPTLKSIKTKYTIEERQYYSVSEDRSLKPFGDKSIIFRGEEESSTENKDSHVRIGPALYTIQGLQDEKDSESLGGSVLESSYATALYCMDHPEIVSGKGLEVESGVGLGGILSSIGAGIASGSASDLADSTLPITYDDDDEGPPAPVPGSLSKIMLTDSNEKFLKICIDNLDATRFPESCVEVGFLDLDKPVPNGLKDQFDFIIGCDSVHSFSEVDPVAKIIGNCLKGSSSLVHIAPLYRESVYDLESKLGRGYGMKTGVAEMVLERIELEPLSFDWDDIESLAVFETGRNGGFVEYRYVDESKYSVLIGQHENVDFDGIDGVSLSSNKLVEKEVDEYSDSSGSTAGDMSNASPVLTIDNQDVPRKNSITSLELLTFADFAAASITDAKSLAMAALAHLESSTLNPKEEEIPHPLGSDESQSDTENDVEEAYKVEEESEMKMGEETLIPKATEEANSIPKNEEKQSLDAQVERLRGDAKGFKKELKPKRKKLD